MKRTRRRSGRARERTNGVALVVAPAALMLSIVVVKASPLEILYSESGPLGPTWTLPEGAKVAMRRSSWLMRGGALINHLMRPA